jgi:hypothetical protein
MSGSSETVGRFGWQRHETEQFADALPLIDEPMGPDDAASARTRMHWLPAAIALALLALGLSGALPPMPW